MYMPRFNADVQKQKPTRRDTMKSGVNTIDSKKPLTKQELITSNIKLLIKQLEAGTSRPDLGKLGLYYAALTTIMYRSLVIITFIPAERRVCVRLGHFIDLLDSTVQRVEAWDLRDMADVASTKYSFCPARTRRPPKSKAIRPLGSWGPSWWVPLP
jgi:hypothetical protein